MRKHLKVTLSALLLVVCIPLYALAIEVYFSPEDGAQDRIVELISNARQTIDVAMYGLTSQELAKALVKAKKRGVQIRMVLDRTQAAGRESQSKYLMKKGLDVRIAHQKGIMHNKVGIVDGKYLITGSYNWTKSAENTNQENCLIITNDDDPNILHKYQERFDFIWQLNSSTNDTEPSL